MIEHRAVPGAAHRKRDRRKQSRARTANGTRRRPDRGNAADAGQCRQQMSNGVWVERKNFLKPDGDKVEQAAVEIEIPEMKDRLIGEAAGIIANNQLAVALLHLLVVRDAVVAEREGDEADQRKENERRREIVSVHARNPPAGFTRQTGHRPGAKI